jgi:transcription-repair coupling factor (superfamily II helicase)
MDTAIDVIQGAGRAGLSGVPEGLDALVLADFVRAGRDVLFVARDDRRMAAVAEAARFFAPGIPIVEIPAWDCLPYDRVSPRPDILSRRVDGLTALAERGEGGRLVLTTVASILQRVPPRAAFSGTTLAGRAAEGPQRDVLLDYLAHAGYNRAEIVMEPGEYAVRGSIVDIFPPGRNEPLRLDYFGDDLEGARAFDPVSQRTTVKVERFALKPISEVTLNEDSVACFRAGYRAAFGAVASGDALYEAVSAGHNWAGYEHWLPLFYDELSTLLDWVGAAAVVLDHQAGQAMEDRWELIEDCYQARAEMKERRSGGDAVYNPLVPDALYFGEEEWHAMLEGRRAVQLHPFDAPDAAGPVTDAGGRPGRDFADIRARPDVNVFDALKEHIAALRGRGRRPLVAAVSAGSRDRMTGVLAEHGIAGTLPAETWREALAAPNGTLPVFVLALERGFETPDFAVIAEQDVLGDRLRTSARRRIRADNFLTEASTLNTGDLVVHIDHGIGRYDGLITLQIAGARHDCLEVLYGGGDKLFVPVENIEVLSRFGEGSGATPLDKLGGVAWQSRKAKAKQRIRDMAEKLIGVAAARALQPGEKFAIEHGAYEEFAARFAFAETDDQTRAIADTLDDLASGRPMDRLICGDVGFGKTEVALRAAFVTAMEGKQVAVVVPTTLLSRQHFQTFRDRFAGFPVNVAQLSRLVLPREAKAARAGLADGSIDIVIGTHALLAKGIEFARLGLLVIDEEQHFGVAHKERLKSFKTDVHVLTLTATPIPRTLQMALAGVREMSLIATAPVDRLAIRTFVLPYDPVVVREALVRERHRGGQTFYVCPRIADLDPVADRLSELVPDLKVAIAHGQMPARRLEEVMTAFYDGAYDVLLSTQIVESGLDLPQVNTMIIHRADRFGLAQLYQLRGRIGRSKRRAYAYLTLPTRRALPEAARRRLDVMQTLDSLGAGFSIASHDMDIRGAGNLLGEEQSGHIREVGVELYQQMLEEAVAEARTAEGEAAPEDNWTPQIDLGMPVLIPEAYVPDLGIRLGLYRRAASFRGRDEIDAFAAELIDRFGPLPDEVANLLEIVDLKRLCRAAGVEKVEAGPKGAVVAFRKNRFANPAGLVDFITAQTGTAKLRPDHRLVFMRTWKDAPARLDGVRYLMKEVAAING